MAIVEENKHISKRNSRDKKTNLKLKHVATKYGSSGKIMTDEES